MTNKRRIMRLKEYVASMGKLEMQTKFSSEEHKGRQHSEIQNLGQIKCKVED
jgi:hypothetical protein